MSDGSWNGQICLRVSTAKSTFAMLSIDSGIGQRGEEMSKKGITERESEVYSIFIITTMLKR
jgi:hypothetical protein